MHASTMPIRLMIFLIDVTIPSTLYVRRNTLWAYTLSYLYPMLNNFMYYEFQGI